MLGMMMRTMTVNHPAPSERAASESVASVDRRQRASIAR